MERISINSRMRQMWLTRLLAAEAVACKPIFLLECSWVSALEGAGLYLRDLRPEMVAWWHRSPGMCLA